MIDEIIYKTKSKKIISIEFWEDSVEWYQVAGEKVTTDDTKEIDAVIKKVKAFNEE